MLNEWKEFQDYTGAVNYTARNKQDTTYLGRFTFDTILDFEGLNRVLTILARGFLFHNENGSPAEAPRERIDYAKRGLCSSTPGTHRLCQAGPVFLVQCAGQQKSHAPGGVAVRQ